MNLDATAVVVAMVTTGPAMVAVLVQNFRLGRRLRTVEDHTSTTAAELTPNHGSSTKDALGKVLDAVGRLEKGQEEANDAMSDLRKDVGGIRSEMRTERTERLAVAATVRQVAERVTELEQKAG